MRMDDIINRHQELSKKLYIALSTMEKKDNIYQMRKEMVELQQKCPHKDANYNWGIVNGHCPYCGKQLTNH